MKRCEFLLHMLAGLLPVLLNAQTQTLDSPWAYRLSYTVSETSLGRFPSDVDFSAISPLDLVEAKPTRLHMRITRQVAENGHYRFETEVLNPETAFAEWPTKIGRIVSDSSGVYEYKVNGDLWHFRAADALYLEMYEEARQENLEYPALTAGAPAFPMPDANALAALTAEGMIATILDNGVLRISDSDFEMEYDPVRLSTVERRYEEGRLASTSATQFAAVEGLGIRMTRQHEIEYDIRPSGMCMERHTLRRYSNYEEEAPNNPRPQTNPAPLALWPNPVSEGLFVQIPHNLRPNSPLRIMSVNGQTLVERSDLRAGMGFGIPVSHLSSGVYQIQIETTEGPQSVKFIKQ